MNYLNRKKLKGFSLIEMVIAAAILSGAVVVISTISTKSLLAVNRNIEYEQAWGILDRQLTMIDHIGINAFLEAGELNGQFGSDETGGGSVHYWEVEATELEADDLYKIDVTISWGPDSHVRRISASTILNGNGTVIESNDENNEDDQSQEDRDAA